ncbi:MAG: hypothetical protein RL607_559 [Bacteroidota bacterium]
MIKKLLFLLLFPILCWSQMTPLSENAKVSILTCGRGDELYTTFGHSAIRVQDSINQLDIVYNYGMFDFSTPNFYFKFVKGDLQYFVAACSFTDFLLEYQMTEREVIEQTLALPQPKVQQLFETLNASLYSEERYYTYKFIDRNCTTMVYEKINALLGKPILKKVDDTSITYRQLLYPYFDNHFYFKLGINILFGAKTDVAAEKMFLPVELLHSLNQSRWNGKPLVDSQKTWVKERPLLSDTSFMNSSWILVLVLVGIALSRNTWIYGTYWTLNGLLGLFLGMVGLYSLHEEVLWNYTILLFNPIYLFIPWVKNPKWKSKLILAALVMLLVYGALMFNKPHLLLMLPFIGAQLFMLRYLIRKEREKLLPSVE